MKTENASEVGKHAFELAGLGLAPFRFTGASDNVITYPDGTTKAGGSCDYCGTGIRLECHIVSADGKRSKVGCNCIDKVGDSGLLKAYKSSPQFRTHQRNLRFKKDLANHVEIARLIESLSPMLAAQPHPYGFTDRTTGTPMTKLDYVKYSIDKCGMAGRASWLKTLRQWSIPSV
jgi:hypothetical protein